MSVLDPSQHTNLLLEIEILLLFHLEEDFEDPGSRELVIFGESVVVVY